VGILDQISILRNPATADLKQDQYSTKMVQSACRRITKVYYFAFRRLGCLARLPNAGLRQTVLGALDYPP
jgi:hypothetical protein